MTILCSEIFMESYFKKSFCRYLLVEDTNKILLWEIHSDNKVDRIR